MSTKRLIFLTLIFFIPISLIVTACLRNNKSNDPRDPVFAGSASCVKCHKDIYDSYLTTAHFQTSRPASVHSVHGSFLQNSNTFRFSKDKWIRMENHNGNLYQVAYANGKKNEAEKFDITIGGVKAETYLYWKGKQLFEMPISYFKALHSWTNSPGYDSGRINFNRPILRRCLECHSSYIKEIPQPEINMAHKTVELDSASLIYGIDCERCHGPGANHVNFHTQFPGEKKAKYITTYSSLTRSQKLDACAVCHSGNKGAFQISAFVFKQGDTLAKFREPDFSPQNPNPATMDVHGNQNGLLASSKCFLMSNMDCSTCHNPHEKESLNLAVYSQKCMQCHNQANHNFCKMLPQSGVIIKNNCIDCHMPAKPSNVIRVESAGGKMAIPYMVRTHRIAVYPEESKKIVSFIKSQKD
jgi:hypothetical protein